ncbi:MAG: acyltransferase [Candidatus Cybelea sp.]
MDGLRAIAVLSVVAFHAAISIPGIEKLPIPWALTLAGKHGVDLFFVLSGFCLSYPTLKRLRDRGESVFSVSAFAAKRLVRILPPYFAAIALLSALAVTLWHFGIVYSVYEPFSWLTVAQNLLFADASTLYVNPSFWTLAVELRWYFFFPFLLWLWIQFPRAFAAVACACVLAYFTRANSLDVSILPAFMLGIVAADMRIRDYRLPLLALPVGIGILASAISQGDINVSLTWQITAFLFVVGVGQSEGIEKVLSVRLLTIVGVASYSIYLVHEPLIRITERFGTPAPAAAAIGIAAGFAFWGAFERPFTNDQVRLRLVRSLAPVARRILQFVGLPEQLSLNRRSAEPLSDQEAAPTSTAQSRRLSKL